jgi:UDP-N-acetylglucosamine acyltransferase
MAIHPLSYVHPEARIAPDVVVEPFVTIHRDVVIESGCWIGSYATVMDGVRIGRNSRIFPGAVLGGVPQDLKFEGEQSVLEIGEHVTIREYCTINRGTRANYKTLIGSYTLLMAYVHIAHDCEIGQHCVLANNTNLAGHIQIGDYAILGGMVGVHQFVKIGKHAIVGGGSLVRKDVPPYVKAAREPLSYAGINSVGMRRRGFGYETIHHIQDIYRILFVNGSNIQQALNIIESQIDATEVRDEILEFIRSSQRGIMKGFRTLSNGNKSV